MQTITMSSPSAEQRERLFFVAMAFEQAAVVAVAFSLFLGAGISSFAAPWWVHVHAVTFMAWIGLYLVQNLLVFGNSLATHRRLGLVGAGLAAWMVLVGLLLTPLSMAAGRGGRPPLFTPEFFLALDWTNILAFAGLVLGALRFRRKTDWHRRLMLCATISVTTPAWGRLLVLGTGALQLWLLILVLLAQVVLGMLADRTIRGRIHPAYYWGAGSILGMGVAIEALAVLPPFIALAGWISA